MVHRWFARKAEQNVLLFGAEEMRIVVDPIQWTTNDQLDDVNVPEGDAIRCCHLSFLQSFNCCCCVGSSDNRYRWISLLNSFKMACQSFSMKASNERDSRIRIASIDRSALFSARLQSVCTRILQNHLAPCIRSMFSVKNAQLDRIRFSSKEAGMIRLYSSNRHLEKRSSFSLIYRFQSIT